MDLLDRFFFFFFNKYLSLKYGRVFVSRSPSLAHKKVTIE